MTALGRLLARVTPWQFLGFTAGITFVLSASFGTSEAGVMAWRLRLASVALAATATFFFDDPAAVTLAPSPTPLLIRRMHRLIGLAAAVGGWWAATILLLHIRFDLDVPSNLLLEFAACAAVSISLAISATRWSGSHAPGMVGAVIAPAWFALGHIPRPDWLVIPPAPGAQASVFVSVICASVALATIASRDPCARPGRRFFVATSPSHVTAYRLRRDANGS